MISSSVEREGVNCSYSNWSTGKGLQWWGFESISWWERGRAIVENHGGIEFEVRSYQFRMVE